MGNGTERWDVYDAHGQPTGITKTRADVWESGEYHLGASLWIVIAQDALLIQKRCATKRLFPGVWAVTGGSVLAGETSRQGCAREAREELGITLDEASLHFVRRTADACNIYDDYAAFLDIELAQCAFAREEVSELRWATPAEIMRLFHAGLFLMDDTDSLEAVLRMIQAQRAQ